MKKEDQERSCCACMAPDAGQRRKLGTLIAIALAPLVPSVHGAQRRPDNKPRAGQRLAAAIGDKKGQELLPADLVLGAEPILAYPMDADGEPIESRVSLLTVLRVPQVELSPEVEPHAPQGIVAYSAVCTHAGCPVTKFKADAALGTQLVCPCHASAFSAGRRGIVTQGPATRRLPLVPLSLQGESLVITGGFDGPLGPPT